jgi:ferredoxin
MKIKDFRRSSMYSKILILRFPKTEVEKPIVCYLVKDYDLTFNILNASVLPRKEGIMVLELTGTRKNFQEGVKYLRARGVHVQNASQEIKRVKKRCTHCGACTAVCPTGALSIQRPEMSVDFIQKKCSVCELCVPACPTRAMEIRPKKKAFF